MLSPSVCPPHLKCDILTHKDVAKYVAKHTILPDSVSKIPSQLFYKDHTIYTIDFPKNLEAIGTRAFYKSTYLREINLPASVTEIGVYAFAECPALSSVTMPVMLRNLKDEVFNSDRRLKKVIFPKNCQTETIGSGAFFECDSLKELNLPDSLLEIRSRAFYRCKELREIHFPPNLKSIGNSAFYFCGLEDLQLPDSLEYFGESAFFKCKYLVHVELPTSVKHIGKWCFHGCHRMKTLTIRHDPEFIGEWIINRAATIRCYKGSVVDKYCQDNELTVEYLED